MTSLSSGAIELIDQAISLLPNLDPFYRAAPYGNLAVATPLVKSRVDALSLMIPPQRVLHLVAVVIILPIADDFVRLDLHPVLAESFFDQRHLMPAFGRFGHDLPGRGSQETIVSRDDPIGRWLDDLGDDGFGVSLLQLG